MVCFIVVWLLLDQALLLDALSLNIVFIAMLLTVLLIGMLAEKGLLTVAAWLSHFMVIIIAALSYGLWLRQPPWLAAWLQAQPLPNSWFTWTPLGQSTWLLYLLALLVMVLFFALLKKRQAFNALVTLWVIGLMFHWGDNSMALRLACATGLLVLLFSALQ